MTNDRSSEPEINAAIYRPDTSQFARTVLLLAIQLDPVDAANQAEVIAEILARRATNLQAVLGLQGSSRGHKSSTASLSCHILRQQSRWSS